MSRKLLIPLVLAGVLVAAPALAEEIVYFTNGTTMAVESHSIEDGTVRVSLGGEGFLAFPLEQIEKIETAQGEVPLPAPGANKMVDRPRTTAGIVRGSQPSRLRRGQWQTNTEEPSRDPVSVDKNGLAIYRPFGANAAPNKRGIGLTGRRELQNRQPARRSTGNKMTGTTRVGARHVLPAGETGDTKIQPVGVTMSGSRKSKSNSNNNDNKKD
jgi:hypothetical protein